MRLAFIISAALVCGSGGKAAAAALIQIQIVEGEGAVQIAGAKASRPLAVRVTDETGKPVEGVAVSFLLPDDGPTGTFRAGLRSEVVTTSADGQAAVWTIQWGRATGPVRVRVTAAREQVRAGTVIQLYLAETAGAKARESVGPAGPVVAKPASRKWLFLAIAAAGAAGGGLALTRASGGAAPAPPQAAASTATLSIGAPNIVVVRP